MIYTTHTRAHTLQTKIQINATACRSHCDGPRRFMNIACVHPKPRWRKPVASDYDWACGAECTRQCNDRPCSHSEYMQTQLQVFTTTFTARTENTVLPLHVAPMWPPAKGERVVLCVCSCGRFVSVDDVCCMFCCTETWRTPNVGQ